MNAKTAVAGALCLSVVLAPRTANALDWQDFWLNDNQRAMEKMQQEHYAAAAETFDDEHWRATAWYRAGEYSKAAEAWAKLDGVEARYNRGNALARAGRLHEAMAAYETVLERDPGHADARHNLAVIKERMQDSGNQSGRQGGQRDSENAKRERRQRNPQQNPQGEQGEPGRQPRQSRSDRQFDEDAGRSNQPERRRQPQTGPEEQSARPQSKGEETPPRPQAGEQTTGTEQPEQRAATEQWLRRIPDDPGGLLRRKFRHQYGQRRQDDEPVEEPW